MVNKKQLEEFYKQNLENDIINTISEMKGIDLRKALDIYYPLGFPKFVIEKGIAQQYLFHYIRNNNEI